MHPQNMRQGQVFLETNQGSCALSLVANRSISGLPQMVVICVQMPLFGVHSVQSLNDCDSLSASIFYTPAVLVAVNQLLLFTHKSPVAKAI